MNLELFEEVIRNGWDTKKGLFFSLLAIFATETFVVKLLSEADIVVSPLYYVAILGVSIVTFLCLWMYRRYWPNNPNRLLIVFAIQTNDRESLKYYQQIKRTFISAVETNGLAKLFSVKFLPADVVFSNEKKAEKYLLKKCISVLVWGSAEEGTITDTSLTAFNVKISYEYVPNRPTISSELQLLNSRQGLNVIKANSLPTIKIVTGNILEMTLMTLAVCLDTIASLETAKALVEILENLEEMLNRRNQNSEFPNLVLAKARVAELLGRNCQNLSEHYYNAKSDIEKMTMYGEKLIQRRPNDFWANQNAALYSWLRGNVSAAINYSHKAHKINPRSPLPIINLAFFDLFEGRYAKALEKYRKLSKKTLQNTNNLKTANFLLEEYEKTNNIALLFGAGWFNTSYVDEVVGARQLKEFIKLSNGDKQYKLLIEAANAKLSNMQTN